MMNALAFALVACFFYFLGSHLERRAMGRAMARWTAVNIRLVLESAPDDRDSKLRGLMATCERLGPVGYSDIDRARKLMNADVERELKQHQRMWRGK